MKNQTKLIQNDRSIVRFIDDQPILCCNIETESDTKKRSGCEFVFLPSAEVCESDWTHFYARTETKKKRSERVIKKERNKILMKPTMFVPKHCDWREEKRVHENDIWNELFAFGSILVSFFCIFIFSVMQSAKHDVHVYTKWRKKKKIEWKNYVINKMS